MAKTITDIVRHRPEPVLVRPKYPKKTVKEAIEPKDDHYIRVNYNGKYHHRFKEK